MSVHTLEVALQRSRDPVRPASEDADLDFLVRLLERRGSVRRSGILALVETWGSIAELFAADPGELRRSGLDPVLVQDLVDLRALAVELTRLEASRRPVVSSWSALIADVRAALAHAPREQFRVLFLDKRNRLLHDELRAEGTVDHAPVYVREVARRALELNASALILVHNHPSGDPTPSRADLDMTARLIKACDALDLAVHDHIIVGRDTVCSLKSRGLM